MSDISAEIVINDDKWQEWNFLRFVESLRTLNERNPVVSWED